MFRKILMENVYETLNYEKQEKCGKVDNYSVYWRLFEVRQQKCKLVLCVSRS